MCRRRLSSRYPLGYMPVLREIEGWMSGYVKMLFAVSSIHVAMQSLSCAHLYRIFMAIQYGKSGLGNSLE